MVPGSVNKLTINQYQSCVDIYQTPDLIVIDREILILSKITSKSEEYFSSLSFSELKTLFRRVPVLSLENLTVKPNKYIFMGGWLYRATLDPSEVNAALFRDIKTYIEKGIDENIHKILACVYRPVLIPYSQKTFERTSRLVKKQKIGDVIGAVFFYSKLLKRSNPAIQIYLENKLKAENLKKELNIQ